MTSKVEANPSLQDVTTALAESEKRFRTLFEQSPLSVQLLSVDGRTLKVNSAWKKLWGYSDDFVENFILPHFNLLEDPEIAKKGILPLLHKGFRGEGGKIPAIYYDAAALGQGRGRWVEAYIEPIFNELGAVQEVVLIHQDVTEKVESEQELKAARDAAEESNRLKTAFLANMSHEIRTPLGAILGFGQILKDPDLPREEAEEYLNIIERNGRALTQIIDDILDLSKVEAGRLKIDTVRVNVLELLEEVMALFKNDARFHGIHLEFPSVTSPKIEIQADPARLRQILINLIGNALKFTHTGSVAIEIETLRGKDNASLKISVIDTGLGIPAAQHHELFQPFKQVDSSHTRKFGGTGLGLVLSRRLAQAMGGDVYLEKSTVGQGSIFVVTLPLIAPMTVANSNSLMQSEAAVIPSLEGFRLLVVDDSSDNRTLLRQLLSKKGAEVSEAINGAEAISKATTENFDVVLMDVQMPIMDGFEAIRRLRELGYDKAIVALTAHVMLEERERCLAAGASAHFAKPIVFKDLNRLIIDLAGPRKP